MRSKPATVTWGGIEMSPFPHSAEGIARAVELANAVSTHESDEHNVALALLIAGIAAIESDSQRQDVAYCAIERALSKSPCIVEAMNELVEQWRGRKIKGVV